MEEKTKRYRYCVLGRAGLEPWTGIFDTKQKAEEWYIKHGEFFKQRGYTLVMNIVSWRDADKK